MDMLLNKRIHTAADEQRILRAPVIKMPDHRAVYNAKCGRQQGGEGVSHIRSYGQKQTRGGCMK